VPGFDPGGFDPGGFDTGAVTTLPSGYLDRPSIIWCFEIFLDSTFPITFPWYFSAPPLRVSWFDLYPQITGLTDTLFEGRLIDRPQVSFSIPDQFGGGVQQIEGVRFRLAARDANSNVPDLHVWLGREYRGKLVLGHLVQLDATFHAVELMQNVFRGEIINLADDTSTVDVLCRALDLSSLTDAVPMSRVTTATYPYAPSGSFSGGGLGDSTIQGIGIGRRLPARYVKARSDDDTSTDLTFTVPDVAQDLLQTSDVHFQEAGMGPLQVSSTGTLPAPLLPNIDYWPIPSPLNIDDELYLAKTRGDALAGIMIDITSTGTGTHRIFGGVPPNYKEEYDVELGHGNLGVVRMWLDESPDGTSEAPSTFTVLPRTYKVDGRYVTAVRFLDPLDGYDVTADVIRVYPDMDDQVMSEWKWLRGFEDDVGGRHAVSDPFATDATTSADLIANHQGFGLGAVNFPSSKSSAFLQVPDPIPLEIQSFTVQAEFLISDPSANGFLLYGPGGIPGGNPSWSIRALSGGTLQLKLNLGGITSTFTSAPNMFRYRVPFLLTLRRDGANATTDVFVNATLVPLSTGGLPATLTYPIVNSKMRFMGAGGGDTLYGHLGWVRFSAGVRRDQHIIETYYRWRRNGIQFARELARQSRYQVDDALFNTACQAWDAVENGSLRADGYLTEPNAIRDVMTSLAIFRDAQFYFTPETRIAAKVAVPPGDIVGIAGHGDDYANMVSLPQRSTASLTESAKKLIVLFRRPRNNVGSFEHLVKRDLNTVGNDGLILELPFCDDVVTADIVADFQSKRRRTRSQLLTFSMNHESRNWNVGDTVRLQVPAMNIAVTAEILQIAKGAEKSDLRMVPTSVDDFVYTPMPLPADPRDRTLRLTDLGDQQTFTVSMDSTNHATLTISLFDITTMRPAGLSTRVGPPFATVVNGPAAWQAVDEEVADDDASYVSDFISTVRYEVFTFPPLVLRKAEVNYPIYDITFRMRIKSSAGFIDADFYYFLPDPATTGGTFAVQSGPTHVLRSWEGPYSYTSTQHDTLRQSWTVALMNRMEAGVRVGNSSPGETFYLTQYYIDVRQKHDTPLPGSFIKYWRVGPVPPLSPIPPAPNETTPAIITALDYAPQTDDLTSAAPGVYYYWAGIFDEFGRLVLVIGDGTQLVTVS